MAVTQKPIKGQSFGETVPIAAWKTIPSWYIVGTEDRAINPDLEHYYAKRIGATTTELKASHVPFLSLPKEVARVIEAAAGSVAEFVAGHTSCTVEIVRIPETKGRRT